MYDFFSLILIIFLIISSHIVFNSILGLLSRGPMIFHTNQNKRGFNKRRSLKFREGSQVQKTPEEGQRIYRPKHCGNNNKNEDNSPKTLNDKT